MLKFLLVVVVIAIAVYACVTLLDRQIGALNGRTKTRTRPQSRPKRASPPRPMGPDDDPDFLRDLNRRQRERRDKREGRDSRPPEPDA